MRILVIGALGTIGRKLVPALVEAGHEVNVSSRDPQKQVPWPELACPRFTLDLLDAKSLPDALVGIELVYYLMHGMSDGQAHSELEAVAAKNLANAASEAGVSRIIYMGSLVSAQPKSEHMLARIATGEALAASGVAVTELRAGIIIAPGSAAFEVMRDLVGHMPLALVPKAIDTQAPPIALVNVLYYLVKLADMPETAGMVLDAAGPEWLSYKDLMLKIAKHLNKSIKIIVLPGLPIGLACQVLGVITSVPQSLAKALIAGLAEQLQAKPDELRALIPQSLIGLDQAIEMLLTEEQVQTYPKRWQDGVPTFRNFSSLHGFYVKAAKRTVTVAASPAAIWQVINLLGGKHRYFYLNSLWAMREWMDFALGGSGRNHGRSDDEALKVGDRVDSWTILSAEENDCLVMRFGMKAPGGGGMQISIEPINENNSKLEVALYWHPAGFWGLVYWYFFAPWHGWLLYGMTKNMGRLAEKLQQQLS
ncbi:SDR family oxidoreductase [Agarivorans sp. TSD2052]|uniref:DUF2867 domain-containing protein n=1 Tax=Agarivorans sp. TSD2052 TaxID=2937286 RepID=UPI00200CAB83|nr:DUF2867 domain-containing protein [Agarivorans sp. TSD2052]UPW17216.1 SDR family oxidoreductase [Agarivorans sp. TSD2052]